MKRGHIFIDIFISAYILQISKGGEDSTDMSYIFKLCAKKKCSTYAGVTSLAQCYWLQYGTFKINTQNPLGQPDGGSPCEGYLRCVHGLENPPPLLFSKKQCDSFLY